MDSCVALTRRVEHLKFNKVAQALEITKLKRRVKKLERRNKVRVLKLRRLQKDDVVVLEDDKEKDREVADAVKDVEEAKVDESAQDQGRQAESQAEIYKIDMDYANKVLSIVDVAPSKRRKGVIIRDPKEESTTSTLIPAETKSKDKGKGILVEELKPLKKKKQIKQDRLYARELHAELNKVIDWDEAIDHVKRKAKEDPTTPAERAAKRRKLDEEVEELKIHLQIVPNKDDDVYTEVTPLARKMMNAARLEVEEEIKVSLELLRSLNNSIKKAS
nr:hypothetical protein [Tanacetum cinerariifolium]